MKWSKKQLRDLQSRTEGGKVFQLFFAWAEARKSSELTETKVVAWHCGSGSYSGAARGQQRTLEKLSFAFTSLMDEFEIKRTSSVVS